ncbi:sodium-dependent neutral amino acid transporter B(0)AT3-like isoform X3 [Bolinopsis microptera]|uniref:sodium-dependent neutral amino acid transporter B(0)AT3-like isoform X3 n=1 Tax=Bolinopsis microptera TaxID=2820187 RepID=UPI003079BE43
MDLERVLIHHDQLEVEIRDADYNPVTDDEKNRTEEVDKIPSDGREQWVEEVEERITWGSNLEFILSTIGSVVGLGNLWRFPIKVKQYGGAVFLIPYFTMLVIEGVPLFLVELWIGQKFRSGCIGGFYKIHKALSGIGFATWMIGFYTNLYYNAIIMYTIYYFFASFQKTLPWAADCPIGDDYPANCCTNNTKSSYYWYYEVLHISPDISTAGSFNWDITLCLLLAWVTCFLCMVKGIKTSGKVVYVTAVFPFIALVGLFIMGMTLEGAMEGVKYFFDPTYRFAADAEMDAKNNVTILSSWRHLYNPYCWLEAAAQIFYSLSLGFGSCIAFSSYNPPKTNFYKHALCISVVNSVTSIFAGVTIFAIVGSNAYKNNISIDQLATGPGLAFIAVSEAIATTPAAQLWSALFFVMLFMLGIDSQFAGIEGMMTALDDTTLIPKAIPRPVVMGLFCSFSFLLGLPFGMQNGQYLVDLFDNFSANFPLMMVAFFEVIAVSWVYGIDRFCEDFEEMTGYYPNIVWRIMWVVVTPLSLAFVLIYSLVDQLQTPLLYGKFVGCNADGDSWTEDVNYPPWAWGLAGILVFSSFLFIPVMAAIAFLPKVLGPKWEITLPLVAAVEDAKKKNGAMAMTGNYPNSAA